MAPLKVNTEMSPKEESQDVGIWGRSLHSEEKGTVYLHLF